MSNIVLGTRPNQDDAGKCKYDHEAKDTDVDDDGNDEDDDEGEDGVGDVRG